MLGRASAIDAVVGGYDVLALLLAVIAASLALIIVSAPTRAEQ
jgi:hypothetical protein